MNETERSPWISVELYRRILAERGGDQALGDLLIAYERLADAREIYRTTLKDLVEVIGPSTNLSEWPMIREKLRIAIGILKIKAL